MVGLVESRQWDSLLTTTLANYRNKLIDNIFDVFPFLSWMNGKLGMAMRGEKIKRLQEGGESIVEQLLYAKNGTVKSYANYEQLDVTPQEGMTIARFNWKQYAVSITISGLEKRSNNGEAALIRLLTAKTTQAEMSLRDALSTDAFGDGTGNASKVLGGLANLVSTTATAGSLSPTTYPWWQSSVTTAAGSFAAGGLKAMRKTFNTISFGNDKPDFLVSDQTTYESYEAVLQPQERYSNTTVANSGFTNLTFKGVPYVFDRFCTSGYQYQLNSKYINFVVHQDADFATGPFITPLKNFWGLIKGFAEKMFDALTLAGVGNSYVAA